MSGYIVDLYLHFPICLHGVHRDNFNLIVTRNSAATVSKGIVKFNARLKLQVKMLVNWNSVYEWKTTIQISSENSYVVHHKHARANPHNMAAIRMNTDVLVALIFIEVYCFCWLVHHLLVMLSKSETFTLYTEITSFPHVVYSFTNTNAVHTEWPVIFLNQ